MPTAQTLVDEVQSEGGFDQDDATVLSWLDRRHKRMVARAKSYRKTVTVGTTVSGTAFYSTASAGFVEVYAWFVGGVPWGKARPNDVYAYEQGGLVWEGQGTSGLIVEDANGSAVTGITLIPEPTESGTAITAYAAIAAPTLALGDSVLVDDDAVEALVEGTIAVGRRRIDKDLGEARELDAIFDAGCDEFRRRVARRFRGAGASQIRIAGING